jgi:hypothetical protein
MVAHGAPTAKHAVQDPRCGVGNTSCGTKLCGSSEQALAQRARNPGGSPPPRTTRPGTGSGEGGRGAAVAGGAAAARPDALVRPAPPDRPPSGGPPGGARLELQNAHVHAFDDLYGQNSVVGSDGFDGLNDEGDSDYFDYQPPLITPPPPLAPSGVVL